MYEANEIPVDDLYIYHHNFAHEVQKHKIYQNFLNRDKKKVKLILTKMDVVPFEHDMEMLVTEVKTCPNTLALLGKDNEELLESRIQPVCEKIYKDTGIKLDGLGLRFFYDDLLADRYEGRSLPKGVTDESWDYIKRAGEYYVIFKRFGSETQRKLFPIFLLNRILELLKDSADNKLPYELVLMSAHDVTMFNFLNALKILTPEDLYNRLLEGKDLLYDFPNFASQLLIELWETDDTKEMLVRILYENKILKLGEKQEEFYSLSRLEELFKASYHPYTERDVYGHCGRQYVERAPKEVSVFVFFKYLTLQGDLSSIRVC